MRKLSFFFLLFLLQFTAQGQALSDAPKAATLSSGTHGSASLYTGQPIVNIPVYTISNDKISVPVALSYNAGGVKVNEHPGWVGLNWNMQAGGYITRKVNDLPDDYDVDLANGDDKIQYGYYWKRSDDPGITSYR